MASHSLYQDDLISLVFLCTDKELNESVPTYQHQLVMMTTIPWINITGNSPLTLSFNLFKDVVADYGVTLHCFF